MDQQTATALPETKVVAQTITELLDEAGMIKELLSSEEKEKKRLEQKPDLCSYVDAVVYLDDGTPVFVPEIGEKVVIERYSTVLGRFPPAWLDTRTYLVKDINHDNGDLKLFDLELQQNSACNFFTAGPIHGYKMKLPTARGLKKGRKKRGAKAKFLNNIINMGSAEKAKTSATQGSGKGRPTGRKNRSKDVIRAEKEEKQRVRTAKKAKRDAKRTRG